MNTSIIIGVILGLLVILGVWSFVKKLTRGSGCCGEHDAAEKKVRVGDRDKRHYPYAVVLTIDGMTCGNCARRVENALNQLENVWAKVDYSTKLAFLRCKEMPDEMLLRRSVRETGYTVTEIKWE